REERVALDVVAHLLRGLPGVVGERVLEPLAHAQDLLRVDLDVRGLSAGAALDARLVDHDAGVGQREALAGLAGGQQHGGGRCRLTEAHGLNVRLDVLHGVVDRGERGLRAAGTVDVQRDVAVGVLRLEHEELGHDVVGGGVVDLHSQEDDAVFEELRVRVADLGAVRGALLELRQDVAGRRGLRGHAAEHAGGAGRGLDRLELVHALPPCERSPASAACLMTLSMKPYSLASSAVNQRSRSASLRICSTDLPVCWAVSSASTFFMCMMSSALMRMSVAVP